MSAGGYLWYLAQTSGQRSASLIITPSDPYFTATTGGVQTRTMEGTYQLTIFAQAGGSYQLQLNVSDGSNITAPLLATNQIATGTVSPGSIFYYRYLTPRGFSGTSADLIFTAYNVSLYISDLTSTPGPNAGNANNNVASSAIGGGGPGNQGLGLNAVTVPRSTATDHVGVFYIAVYRPFNVGPATVNYSLSASFTQHTVLNGTFVSDDPLLSGQIRYFDYYQQGLTTINLQLLLSILDTTQYGNVYINIVQLNTPTSTAPLAYPGPNTPNQQLAFPALIGNASAVTGEQLNTYNYACTAQYRCTWQIALYAPLGQNLQNYTLQVTPLATLPRATLIPLGGSVNGTATLGFGPGGTASAYYYFVVDSWQTVNITCVLNGTSRPVQIAISRSSGILTSNNAGDFDSPANGFVNQTSVFFAPSSPVFGVNLAPNVGSPFLATYYVRVTPTLFGQGTAVFTLYYTNGTYNGTIPTLINQPLTTATPYRQALGQNSVAYYNFTAPATLTSGQDVIITCMNVNPTAQANGPLTLYWSTTQQYPSQFNNDYRGTTASAIVNSIVLSATDNTALQPGQTVYVSVAANNNGQRTYIITAYVVPRLSLSSSALSTGVQSGPFQAGYAQVVDFTTGYPSPLSVASFVAGLSVDQSTNPNTTMPPYLLQTTYLNSVATNAVPTLSTLQTSNAVNYYPIANNYLAGDYKARVWDVCTALQNSGGCTYHYMVFFPQALNSWQLTVSNLVVDSVRKPLPAIVVDPVSTTNGGVAAGAIVYYNVTVPLYYLMSATMVVTLTSSAGNADLYVLAPDYNANTWNAFTNNNAAPSSYLKRSYNATAPDVITLLYNDTSFNPYGNMPANIVIGVVGTTAATYQLSVLTTGSNPNMTVAGVLSLDSTGNTAISGTAATPNNLPVYQFTVPNDGSAATADLFINLYTNNPQGQGGGGPGGNRVGQFYVYQSWYPYIPQGNSWVYFPAGSWAATAANNGYAAMLLNANSALSLTPGATYYIQVMQGTQHTITLSYIQRVPLSLGQIVTGSSIPGRIVTYTLTLPAQKVGSQWSTSANFVAALSSLNTTARPAHWLLLTRANVINSTVFSPYNGVQNGPTRATANAAEQILTVTDVCSFSSCVWSVSVYTLAANCSYTFSFAPINAYNKLTPGFTTTPTYIAADQMAYYTFTLPHPQMEAIITLQSLLTGSYGNPSTNADLFVSQTVPRPDPQNNQGSSISDTPYGTDQVPIDNRSGNRLANSSYYVSVFGQRPGYYTLSVQAVDPGAPPMYITNNEPDVSVVPVGSSNYYQYNIGQVSGVTDLSLVLSTNVTGASPQLYATFSYTHPGPITYGGATYLPSALPYEMFSTSSSSVTKQLTLNQKLSSSNVLPLQAQSSLFVAVYGSSSGGLTTVPYALSVSVSKRITLALGQAVQMTLVGAGSVQYYEFTFANTPSKQQAFVVLTGLDSDISLLPPVYITNPSISALVDPIVSSTSSYTSAMVPAAGNTYNAMQSVVSADCSQFPNTACTYKAMVYTPNAMPAYALSVTTFNDNDQAPLSATNPTLQSVPAAGYRFYYFDVTADILLVNLTLYTGNDDGNADIFVSTTNQHPNNAATANYQWSSVGRAKSMADNIAIRSTDAGFTAGRWYVSVFGQRASTFQLALSLKSSVVPPASTGASGVNNGGGDSESSSGSSFNVVALATLLPIIGVLAIAALVLLYLYKTKKAAPKAGNSSPSNNSDYGSHRSADDELPHLDVSTPSPRQDGNTPSPHPSSPGIKGGASLTANSNVGMEMTPRRRQRELDQQRLGGAQQDSEYWNGENETV